jgi:hypothetical protein
VQDFGGLGKAALVDNGLQGAPLIEGDPWGFHLCSSIVRLISENSIV